MGLGAAKAKPRYFGVGGSKDRDTERMSEPSKDEHVLSTQALEFIQFYCDQPDFKRDPVSAFQKAFPLNTRIASAYKRAIEILNTPQAQQAIATITGRFGKLGESKDLDRNERALQIAWRNVIKAEQSDNTHDLDRAMKTYSSLCKAFLPNGGESETKPDENGPIDAILGQIRDDSEEKLQNS